jgi:alginate O-acetyltransferase complex protein AlgI
LDFNSPIFLFLFLPLFMAAYLALPGRGKLVVGILGSLLFYAWGALRYLPLLVVLALFTYLLALALERLRSALARRVLTWVAVLLILSLLIAFKLGAGAGYPLGLSYLTFQAIAYLVEVYTGKSGAEKNILDFFFYLLLFPKIPVGPIVRYSQIHLQIAQLRTDPVEIAEGLRRFIRGLAKKVLIADTLGRVVAPVFALSSPVISPPVAWLVIVSFALQLYFDFSGFTDMAIGVGRMMGLKFIENFDFPYISKSIGEFWRRWHISLSSWFRDIVFYPLERRRLKLFGQPINILIVFILTGLWHGLAVNYIIWGLIHGLALVFEATYFGKRLRTLWAPLQHLYALGVLLVGWVFFRSPTPDFAFDFLRRLIGDNSGLKLLPFNLTSPLPFIEPTFVLALLFGVIFSLPVGPWVDRFLAGLAAGRLAPGLGLRLLGDLVLVTIMAVSIAATSNSAFLPGIYGSF